MAEHAAARTAHAATIRQTSRSVHSDSDQILELFHLCIKLASENKINQKNTWELDLIDHLTHIIRDEDDNHAHTNFQMASCILEAGVKIYSLRVDSLYSETYKVLARMTRAGQESEQGCSNTSLESVNAKGGQEDSKKGIVKKLSPLSTLESSLEALNIKKFDVAFSVDPLYRQTLAKFDKGGAKGLLMNNLGVYGGCRVLFDSLDVPEQYVASQNEHDSSYIIDLSFARDCIQQMMLDVRTKDEISPTLGMIVNRFDENNKRPSDFQCFGHKSAEEVDAAIDCEVEAETEDYETFPTWPDEHDNQTFVAEAGSNDADPRFSSYPQEKKPFPSQDPEMDELFGNVDEYLSFSLGFRLKKNAWAGPDHWKYHKAKGSKLKVRCSREDGSTLKTRPPKTMRQIEVDLDFTNSLGKTPPDIFAPPKNPKLLLFPENRRHCVTKLPEDCHYEPEDLVKLFLLPRVNCLGMSRVRKFSDESTKQCNNNEPFHSWDNGGVFEGEYDGAHSDMDDSSKLISQPCQVNKVEVQYDKTAKQVDVQALKLTLWNSIQGSVQQGEKEMVFFRDILANFPSECNAAANVSDITPHLCFICLLHLANEKELSIQSCPNLDELRIYMPA
ncbi:condensin complex subunit 2-like [Vicia villosa]|uniref:condensin complex subunit 2-like n=1 Tax=Vicia villosa TaxID=3911 RepID=UPI00273AEE99|nr:condensin complex subunit 2-like [Vicia villosa]